MKNILLLQAQIENRYIHHSTIQSKPLQIKKGVKHKMVFISSQLPLKELQTMSSEEICNQDWFLFDWQIKTKKYHSDENLDKMYYRLICYPIFYRERIYNYLISDKFYFSSQLYNTLKCYAQIIWRR